MILLQFARKSIKLLFYDNLFLFLSGFLIYNEFSDPKYFFRRNHHVRRN